MLKDFAWNAFEMTGNIDMYVFYKEITNIRNEEIKPDEGLKPALEG